MTASISLFEAKQRDKRKRMNGAHGADEDGGDDGIGSGRRVIQIKAAEQSRVVDETEEALIEMGAPVYVRAGSLVQPILEEALATGGRATVVGRIKILCQDALTDLIGRVVTFNRYSEARRQWVKTDPPRWVASHLLARAGLWKFHHLAAVITTPTLRPDGSMLDAAGYDPKTHLFLFLEAGFRMPRMEARPSRQAAEEALLRLSDLLANFPFEGPVDRAVALSSMLTTVARPCLPVAPLHAIRARSPGTGKSFLIDLFSAIATGQCCPAMAAGKTEEETEKRLGARLLQGNPIISIDNVNGELGGDMLCQMTERTLVAPRILGQSAAPDIECRAMVFANGNNLTLVGDMTRRAVLCTLDAKVERPELREFAFDPITLVLQDRGLYVAAVLTILRAYHAAGSPNRLPPIGSYGAWSDTVRSALVWLGEADPVASMETTRAENPDLAAQRELFEHWHEQLAEASFYTAAQIIEVACEREPRGELIRPDFRAALIRKGGKGTEPSPIPLGRWLSSIRGQVLNGYRLEVLNDEKRGNRFALCRAREGER